MKNTLLSVICWVCCAALVIGAIGLGAVRGWRQERAKALSPDAVAEAIEERAMDAANLLVVASRHLPEDDERLTELRALRATLTDASGTADALLAADAALTDLAGRLGRELPLLPSVQASARDQAYVSALTQTLTYRSAGEDVYRARAERFNERLTGSLSGKLAMLLGVAPIPTP